MRAVFDSCVKQDNIEPGSFLLGTFRAIESDATETPFPSGLAQTPEETCEARDLLLTFTGSHAVRWMLDEHSFPLHHSILKKSKSNSRVGDLKWIYCVHEKGFERPTSENKWNQVTESFIK